jgi:hypothetical protein
MLCVMCVLDEFELKEVTSSVSFPSELSKFWTNSKM